MRQKFNPQLDLFNNVSRNPIVKELGQMSKILDDTPGLLDLVFADLVKGVCQTTGREGMTAEQVLRCAILKQYRQLTYEELAFHLEDSASFRGFSRLEMGQDPGRSILQENIKAIREETWEAINQAIVGYAMKENIESGKKARIDSTVVETNIHHPTDSTLLRDGVRVITRLLSEGKELSPSPGYTFSDHERVVKKRLMVVINTKKEKSRQKAYRDLLVYARKASGYAATAAHELSSYEGGSVADTLKAGTLAQKLERMAGLLDKVIDQTDRRVFKGETVPAAEKVVSMFEDHTDIIVKSRRGTEFGHKVFFSGGPSGVILDCLITRGNPADSEQYKPMLDRHKERFGRAPRQVSADGGFASKDNLAYAKGAGVKDAVFAKKRGLSVLDMAKSHWVYKKLRNFRAGIEAGISVLKRAFGLDRCTWTGWGGFGQYVWSSVVSYNLLTIARVQMAAA